MTSLSPITYKGSNILVSAGAGCGKTYNLTKRVVHFIKNEGYRLDEFLILTFTKLAAGEMKDRIRRALIEEGSPEARNVDFADICTFDSYALSLVKRYHFKLGIPSDVKNIDEAVIEVKKREILDSLFNELYESGDKSFLALIEKYCFRDDDKIRDLILRLHRKALLSGDVNNYLATFKTKYFDNNLDYLFTGLMEAAKYKVIGLIDKIAYLPKTLYKQQGRGKPYDVPIDFSDEVYLAFSEVIKLVRTKVMDSATYNTLIDKMLDKSIKIVTAKNDDGTDSKERASFVKQRTDTNNYLKALPRSKDDLKTYLDSYRGYLDTLLSLVGSLDKKINEFKLKLNAYEFEDIARMAYTLLDDEEIRLTIKNKLKMIMVDEYQDTSKLQDEFVMKIANDNLFLVGDVKQSIYRFRYARCDLFMDKYNSYKNNNGGALIGLNKSFRSKRSVIKDINTIFDILMTEDQGGCKYQPEHELNFGETNYDIADPQDINRAHNIDLLTFDDEHKDPENQARLIAIDILNKLANKYQVMDKDENGNTISRDVRADDFAIIMDRGGDFSTYLKVFNEYKIAIYAENDEVIDNSLIPLVLTNLLRIARFKLNQLKRIDYKHNPMPRKAIISVARSFIYSYSDSELLAMSRDVINSDVYKEIDKIVYDNRYLPLGELFSELISKLKVYERLYLLGDIDKNSRVLDYYLDRVRDMSSLGFTIDEFISFMEEAKDSGIKLKLPPIGSNVNSVKLINIHKSKGLQYKIIYYSGLLKHFNEMDLNAEVNSSDNTGLILPSENPNDLNILKEIHGYYERKEEASERLRQLYVALTRAREKIILVYPAKKRAHMDNGYKYDLYHKRCLYEYLDPVISELALNVISYDLEDAANKPKVSTSTSSTTNNLVIDDSIINSLNTERIQIHRPSKKLDLSASKKNLEFGNRLHMYMELTDLKNVDVTKLTGLERKTVEGFLNSELAKNIKSSEVYKEYEFYYNEVHGIIDLMLIYSDHIDIIDYKTNDISKPEYDVQLNTYMEFAEERFQLPARGYLYSLQSHDYKEVEKTIK